MTTNSFCPNNSGYKNKAWMEKLTGMTGFNIAEAISDLTDSCLTAQDHYKELLNYFKIKY